MKQTRTKLNPYSEFLLYCMDNGLTITRDPKDPKHIRVLRRNVTYEEGGLSSKFDDILIDVVLKDNTNEFEMRSLKNSIDYQLGIRKVDDIESLIDYIKKNAETF